MTGYEIEDLKGMVNFVQKMKKSLGIRFLIEIKTKKNLRFAESILKKLSKNLRTKKLTDEDYLFIL